MPKNNIWMDPKKMVSRLNEVQPLGVLPIVRQIIKKKIEIKKKTINEINPDIKIRYRGLFENEIKLSKPKTNNLERLYLETPYSLLLTL